jgi:predicted YcjX-like family ATPase
MGWLDHRRRIAVTGLAGAGKTVFLLSLLQNIEHFNPNRFRLAGGGSLGAFRELAPATAGFELFPRTRLRARLIATQDIAWPEKTRNIYCCRCAFDYSGLGLGGQLWNILSRRPWLGRRRVEWEFLDFPGERFSDALMARHASFPAWSDAVMELWEISEPSRRGMDGFLSLMAASLSASGEELLLAYKRCLAAIVHGKNQLITPSTFMLGPEAGEPLAPADLLDGGTGRLSGLPGGEFVPLSRDFRAARPDLTEIFSRHYGRYREELILPVFNAVNACDVLLVLVDIPGILSGGVGRYNDASHLLEILADVVVPSGWFSSGVKRLALIAAKADMIHARDQDSLAALADDMLRLIRNRRPEIGQTASFPVASWVSARSVDLDDGGRALQGIPARSGGRETRIFRVPELRPEWPGDWEPEDPAYSYPRLSPPRLANQFIAPEQWNLEKVFNFILA